VEEIRPGLEVKETSIHPGVEPVVQINPRKTGEATQQRPRTESQSELPQPHILTRQR
jgi:hypothetical protein